MAEYSVTVENAAGDDQDYLPNSVASVDSDGTVTVTGEFNETYRPDEWSVITIERT